jgi:ribosomal protein S18 acetylase RimI-like enzyme
MCSWSSKIEANAVRAPIRARLVTLRERDAVQAYLAREPRHNLLLMEMVAGIGQPATPSEMPPQVLAAWQRGEIVGITTLRPSVVVDFEMGPDALGACLPMISSIETGLIKSVPRIVTPLWRGMQSCGRRALIDRNETAYGLPGRSWKDPAPSSACLRPATDSDLEDLVHAARASLREEDRPDPFDGDPAGFRRWVKGRLHRARLVEVDGRVGFVGYADVRRSDGWLIQGVYTWPECRRQGFARAGMSGLIREAFESGADHVQLAVVEGNLPAIRLYEGLGFEPFSELRTILFV